MSIHQASRKAETMQMIKTLVGLLEHIKTPEASKQFEKPPTEWMEATDKDFEEVARPVTVAAFNNGDCIKIKNNGY